jgi:hypothetical protein
MINIQCSTTNDHVDTLFCNGRERFSEFINDHEELYLGVPRLRSITAGAPAEASAKAGRAIRSKSSVAPRRPGFSLLSLTQHPDRFAPLAYD